jgi:hypothetical protein
LTIKELDLHVEKVMKVLQKMKRFPDAALSESLKKQTMLNGVSAPNKLPHYWGVWLSRIGVTPPHWQNNPGFKLEFRHKC